MADNEINTDLIALTAGIVSAHVSHNNVGTADLPGLIASVHAALEKTSSPTTQEPAKIEPAVSVRSSIKRDHLVCLEDGKKLKMLKRYLRTNYDMSPDEYRAKWNLPRDYPMVAPEYAEQRRGLAKSIGLGRKKVAGTVATVKAGTAPVVKAAKAGRKKLGIAAAKAAAAAHLGTDGAAKGEPKIEGSAKA